MYYCKKCGFSVTGSKEKCPFCRGDMTGEPDGENVFPEIPYKEQKNDLLIRLLALGTVTAAAVCIAQRMACCRNCGEEARESAKSGSMAGVCRVLPDCCVGLLDWFSWVVAGFCNADSVHLFTFPDDGACSFPASEAAGLSRICGLESSVGADSTWAAAWRCASGDLSVGNLCSGQCRRGCCADTFQGSCAVG